MFTARNLHKPSLKSLSDFVHSHSFKSVLLVREVPPQITGSNTAHSSKPKEDRLFSPHPPHPPFYPFNSWYRSMSTSKGRSMRSKVENRMRKESGKTLREMRRAKKIQKKLMTENERLIFNLKRAKKKVSLLLQKLKKYELPELPQPQHDPEILTLEQLQAYKKIGFRNKNYVPVGVRGVFGGVVQNMHMHWKFHETVQVCCDNFPKEKIKEMATMLARLSGGIVISVHNVKTIIMFRGRNYRQPKNLIPINTLTKRKALFKARFEQALESQKLNIKKIEQQLRQNGINPEDPVVTASIQRVASSFFNAIDKKEGSPYVFHGEKVSIAEHRNDFKPSELEAYDEREQEELDKFIADIEEAAEREWMAEEAVEKEELGKIRYRNREEFSGKFKTSESPRYDSSDDDKSGTRGWKVTQGKQKTYDSDVEDNDDSDTGHELDSDDVCDPTADSESDNSLETKENFEGSRRDRGKQEKCWSRKNEGFKTNVATDSRKNVAKEDAESEDMLSDLENAMWQSNDEEDCPRSSNPKKYNYRSDSDEEDLHEMRAEKGSKQNKTGNVRKELAENGLRASDTSSDSENASWDTEVDEDSKPSRAGKYKCDQKNGTNLKRTRTEKEMDETWESD